MEKVGPLGIVLNQDGELGKLIPHEHIVAAKSLYDCLSKEVAGGRHDRRSAIDMAIIRDNLKNNGTIIRWVPHPLMPADGLTKEDVSRGSDALSYLLRRGLFSLKLESESQEEVRRRAVGRSRGASRKLLELLGPAKIGSHDSTRSP